MNWTKWQFASQTYTLQWIIFTRWLEATFLMLELLIFYCWLWIKINHPVLKIYFCFSVPGIEILLIFTMNASQLLLNLNDLCLSKPCIIVTQISSCNCKHTNPKLKVHYSHNRRHVEAFHNDREFPFWLLLIFNLFWPEVSWQTDTIDWFLRMCVNDSPFYPFALNSLKLALTMMIFRKWTS